jgi:hypothetical protein
MKLSWVMYINKREFRNQSAIVKYLGLGKKDSLIDV